MTEFKKGDRVRHSTWEGHGVILVDEGDYVLVRDDYGLKRWWPKVGVALAPVDENVSACNSVGKQENEGEMRCATTVHPESHESACSDDKTFRATDIASKASELVGGDRDRQHGAKHDNFSRIAELWSAWLRVRKNPAEAINAHDVGVMMALMKLARTQSGALNIDDYIDACGYAACAGEVAQADAS